MFAPGVMMLKNECFAVINIFNKIFFSIVVLFFIVALAGCSKDIPVETEVVTAKVAGRIQDGSYLNRTRVKLLKLEAPGITKTVSLEDVFTNSDGKFILETNLDGESNLLIQADKDNEQLRGIITAKVEPGITVYSQPLGSISNVCTYLYTISIESGENVAYTQFRILINQETAGLLENNMGQMNVVSRAVTIESDAEEEIFLRPEIGGTTSQWQHIVVAKIAAQTVLDRDLYYSLSESAQQSSIYNYLSSVSDAYVEAGLQSDTFSKVLEASVRAFLKEIGGNISPQLDFEFLRSTAVIRARIMNVAVLSEFQKLGADPSLTAKVILSGDNLLHKLIDIDSAEDIADEFAAYRDQCLENLIKVLGVYGNKIQTFQTDIENFKVNLITDIENSSDTGEIISAYLSFYNKITNLVGQQFNSQDVVRNAATEVLILLNMYF